MNSSENVEQNSLVKACVPKSFIFQKFKISDCFNSVSYI